ncbi:uncharacterized protein LOC143294580 [Babylonia areolata]|uniref:uncharacterized protein LOC143294580 n=1 Tax=Babylonia areolata TaxID=304850 RepID=UPI003FD50689
MGGADCWTDHYLIVSKVRLHILPDCRPPSHCVQGHALHSAHEKTPRLLTDKEQILERWAEHFKNVFNRPANINDEVIARLPQVEINEDLDTLPTEDELRKAVKQLSCGKAQGPDAIPAEQGLLQESQCGFRAELETVDMMIFAVRQLQEKCQEQHSDLFMTFVDLTKAFDMVSREGLWKIMEKFGCPNKFITIVQQFHDSIMVKVLDDGDESEAFRVTNGIKQCCVLALTLFSMVFSAILTDAFRDCEERIHVRYKTDGRLLNLRHLQDVTKVKETVVRNFSVSL